MIRQVMPEFHSKDHIIILCDSWYTKKRLFFSTIFPEDLQIFCAWQEKAPLNQTGSDRMKYIPLLLYSLRWNIETSYYEQKAFWSFCNYMVRSCKGIAMHWQHRFNHMVGRYNDIYRVQMPNITPHVCRHTYCSNMAKSGMNPKTLQYLMGHSDISVTMNVYTHIGFDDAEEELKRMEEFRKAQAEVEQKKEKPMSQKMFKVV